MDIVERLAQWAENDMKAEAIALEAKYEIERRLKESRLYWDAFQKAADEIERLREALRFYAEWGIDAPAVDAIIEKDRGDKARAALKEGE